MLTAHQLARMLLEGPDLIVETRDWMDGEYSEISTVRIENTHSYYKDEWEPDPRFPPNGVKPKLPMRQVVVIY